MKSIIIFAFLAVFASFALAQDQIQNQPAQPQDQPPQGWYKQNSGTTQALSLLTFANRDSIWAGSFNTANAGNTWMPNAQGVNVVQFVDSLHGWGLSGKGDGWIAATIDGGQHWNDYNTGFDAILALYFCTPNRGFCHAVVNSRDRIARTIDGGKTWIPNLLDTVGQIAGFACIDSLTVYAFGAHYIDPQPPHDEIEALFLTTDGGLSWKFRPKDHIKNGGFNGVAVLDSQTVILIANTTFSFRSTNRGYTLPLINFAGETSSLVLFGISASDKYSITVVGSSGKIYRSYDGGLNWVQQNSGTTAVLYAVTFIDSVTGWVVGAGGTILHTTNAGYSWVKQQIPQPLEVKVNPEPFATKTTLSYSIPHPAKVDIKVYDITGKEVYHTISPDMQSEGLHSIEIPAERLPAGVYTFLLVAGGFYGMGKMTKIVP